MSVQKGADEKVRSKIGFSTIICIVFLSGANKQEAIMCVQHILNKCYKRSSKQINACPDSQKPLKPESISTKTYRVLR